VNEHYVDTGQVTTNSQIPTAADWLNLEDLVTEDDEPVNLFSEKQQRFLITSLYGSWLSDPDHPQKKRAFLAMANVGLFYALDEKPLVPNILVSLDVRIHDDLWSKLNRSYFVSQYGKPPDIAIEIVSDLDGNEDTIKLQKYAKAKVRYYVIFDPLEQLKHGVLRVYELRQSVYVEKSDWWLDGVGLGLTLWEGRFEDIRSVWLRWCEQKDQLILTGTETTKKWAEQEQQEQELAEQARQETEIAEKQAEQARQEIEIAEKQAKQIRQEIEITEKQTEQIRQEIEIAQKQTERFAAKLRELGIEPDML
jgi:hypothetical protein